ncbi:MAG: MotA/TolQ/ExbB proton channel family protein [Planctomycetota bacterium]
MSPLVHAPVSVLTAAPSGRSLFDYIAAGGWVGTLIILLSVAALGLVLAQFLQTRASRFVVEGAEARLDKLLRKDRINDAVAFCNQPDQDCFLTRVFGSGLDRCSRSPFGYLEIKSALEEAGREEVERLYRQTDWIGLIATVAPMLGLLGTVLGILIAFDKISTTEGVPRPGDLAGGISQALVTTVLGLLIAIPTSFAFTFLRNRIDTHAAEAGRVAERLAARLEGAAPGKASGGPEQAARPVSKPKPAAPQPAAGGPA